MRDKSITIPVELFGQLLKYHIWGDTSITLQNAIRRGLERKLDKVIAHDLYTRYKSAGSAEEREQARQEYLEKVGIPADFRF